MPKTIYDIADEYKISVRKARLMLKNGDLNIDSDTKRSEIRQIAHYLKKARPLTVSNILTLLRHPEKIDALGAQAKAAKKYLASLGNVERESLSASQAANMIYGASISDEIFLPKFAQWLASVIPASGCGYHYLAVRAILNVPENRFSETYRALPRAILHARRTQFLSGMSEKADIVRFFRPEINFDL